MGKLINPREKIRNFKEEVGEVERQPLQLAWLTFAGICITMCLVNYTVGNMPMACVLGGIALWFFLSASFFFKNKVQYMIYNMMIVIILMSVYFVVDGGEHGYSSIWLLLVPAVCMYFLGLYYGSMLSFCLMIIITVYMWTPLQEMGYQYLDSYLLRFPIVYILQTFMCFIIHYRIFRYRREQEHLLSQAYEANRSKSDFLANMSHEIRTPMNSIMGMCELILNDDISDDIRDNANNIYISGKNLLGIINDLLDFSKIESGKMELIEDSYQLSSLLNDVINMAVARKGEKDIEFIVDCDAGIPDKLYGDEIRIRQVLINLLTNAIKFTREGGVLFKIYARPEEYGVNLVFIVKDSGIGIKEENLQKIFRSFSQVDTKKNRSIEGTGLGLAISKQLITQMGGFIKVESEYGKGTEFTVVIPQRIMEPEPIIEIKNKHKVKVLAYIGMKKYQHAFVAEYYYKVVHNIAKGFDIKFCYCPNLEKTKQELESRKGYTHIFLAREEYLEDKAYFDMLAKEMDVIVVQDHKNRIKLGEGVRNIYKPFYVLPVGNAINGDRLSFNVGTEKMKRQNFEAPNANILVVDDNMMNLKVAIGLLKPYKMSVRTVDSGVEALRVLQSQQFDLIFMDHMMPEMDGVETVHHIRAMQGEYYQQVPIIALTANAVNGAREMFLDEGFQDFLAKPIEMGSMERILKRWLPKEMLVYKEDGNGE